MTPIPSFPQIQSADLEEGECRVFMNTLSLMMVNLWLGDGVDGWLVAAKVGGLDGE